MFIKCKVNYMCGSVKYLSSESHVMETTAPTTDNKLNKTLKKDDRIKYHRMLYSQWMP